MLDVEEWGTSVRPFYQNMLTDCNVVASSRIFANCLFEQNIEVFVMMISDELLNVSGPMNEVGTDAVVVSIIKIYLVFIRGLIVVSGRNDKVIGIVK